MNHHVPVIVRPWEKQTTDMIGGSDETCLRLTAAAAAAALTLCHWQAINSMSPLCALYKMTTSNFVHSLNADNLQGWGIMLTLNLHLITFNLY